MEEHPMLPIVETLIMMSSMELHESIEVIDLIKEHQDKMEDIMSYMLWLHEEKLALTYERIKTYIGELIKKDKKEENK